MKITFSELSTKNLATLAKRTIDISNKPEHTVVKDNPLRIKVQTAYTGYDAVYAKNTFSGLGTNVLEADADRDAPYSGIKTILRGYSKTTGFARRQDATDLYAIIESHGIDLDRYSYSEESAQLNKLIEAFDKPENATKLANLHLTEIFAQLKTAQAAFEALFAQQVSANAELRQMESASSIRRNLETTLRNYINIVTAMKELDGWKELYAELNEAVKAARNSKLDATDKKAEETAK